MDPEIDKLMQQLGAMTGVAAHMSRVQFVMNAALEILKSKMAIGEKISDEQIEDAARLGGKLVQAVFRQCGGGKAAAGEEVPDTGMTEAEVDDLHRRGGSGA